MPRRRNDPGFGLVFVAAAVIAVGFAAFLFWRSQQKADRAANPPEPPIETPAPTPTPAPAPAPAGNAQPLEASERLPLGTGSAGVRYSAGGGAVTFEFDIGPGESPSIDVDFDRNGAIDEGIDRSFSFFPDGRYCAQAILSRDRWGECGSIASAGSVELARQGKRTLAFLRIPARELSDDSQTAFVTFKLCTGKGRQVSCRQSPGGRADGAADFTDEYLIRLQ